MVFLRNHDISLPQLLVLRLQFGRRKLIGVSIAFAKLTSCLIGHQLASKPYGGWPNHWLHLHVYYLYIFLPRFESSGMGSKRSTSMLLSPIVGISSADIVKYIGWAQPYCAYVGLGTMIFTVVMYGYSTFLPGWWDTGTFFSYYTMVFVCPILYVGWKVVKKTKVVKPEEAGMLLI